MTQSPWLSVVIPIKDERENLAPLTSQLIHVLRNLPEPQNTSFEILYIDDGSTDGSEERLDQLAEEYPEVLVLHLDKNYGQTAAFDAGFRHARGELVATLDGDLQYDPADLLILLPFASRHDLVCGQRAQRHDTFIRRLSSRIAFFVRKTVIHDTIHDTGCSLKIFRKSMLHYIPPFKGMHRFYPALAKIHGLSVVEIPVQHFPRIHGQSKYGISNRLFSGLYDLIAIRWMQRRYVHYQMKEERKKIVHDNN